MPGFTEFGEYDEISDSHFACDARGMTGGNLCPEITLLEANMYGYRLTPRACNGYSVLGHWDSCDGYGDFVVDIYDHKDDFTYGPGGDIDTNSAVDVTIEFLTGDDNDDKKELTGYSLTLK